MDITLINYMEEQLRLTPTEFKRYKYRELPWEARLVGLMGPRGVGKSTMVLQHIKEQDEETRRRSIYVSADHSYFLTHTLEETADCFVREGGVWMYIDEVHKYDKWSIELKQIYDSHPELHVFFTGSSILDIMEGEADLSRRVLLFDMQGLSFREYLAFFHGIEVPVFSLSDILTHKATIPGVAHPLPLFKDYLQRGYYPFAKDVDFDIELNQVITQTMETDIPNFANISVAAGRKLKQLLMVIAKSTPFKPVYQKLADVTNLSRNDIPNHLYYMERAGIIAQLRDNTSGVRGLGKVEKVYLDNTNLIYALAPEQANIGNLRETFFMNQMRVNHNVVCSKISDFEIDGATFEIGGKKKGQKQIETAAKGYIVKDDIEFGYANITPLWAFGLNY